MAKYAYPSKTALADLITEHGKAGAARILGIPVSTFKDHVSKTLGDIQKLSDDPNEDHIEIPVFFRNYSHLDQLTVFPLSDLHIGAQAHAEERWLECLDYIKNSPTCSIVGTGDFLDAALKDSKSESYDATMTSGKAKRKFQDQISEVSDKVDLLIRGNHEYRIYRAVGDCPIEDVCHNLNLNYSRDVGLLVYKIGDIEYDIYVRHGTGSGAGSIGSRANQLQKQAHVVFADVYISGHTHSQLVSTDTMFVRDGDSIKRVKRYYVASGSFMGYESYASERAYVAGKIGTPKIILSGEQKQVNISI